MNWKKTARYGVLGAAVAVFGFGVLQQGQADGFDPGSDQDPLVTQSYVDNKVKTYVDERLKNLGTPGSNQGGTKLEVVELAAGQRIIFEEGAEVIVRGPGNAKAITSSQGGLADVTGGKDLADGVIIPKNHLLIIPRSDGRGMTAQSKTFLMVRGSYTVQ